MTSSVASDRTPPPSSPSRPVAGSAPNLLKRFFLMCSGATPELLYAPSCLTELNKYAMLGALICFTAGFAALSGGYAAYTAFRDTAVATALGVLWGLFIFTLDRLIVSGIRKQQHEPNDTWSVWLGKSLRDLLTGVPQTCPGCFSRPRHCDTLRAQALRARDSVVYGPRHPDASHRSRAIGPGGVS